MYIFSFARRQYEGARKPIIASIFTATLIFGVIVAGIGSFLEFGLGIHIDIGMMSITFVGLVISAFSLAILIAVLLVGLNRSPQNSFPDATPMIIGNLLFGAFAWVLFLAGLGAVLAEFHLDLWVTSPALPIAVLISVIFGIFFPIYQCNRF